MMIRNKRLKQEEELVNYVEQEAKIAERFAIDCLDVLERQGNLLLNILLSGAGGALALSISLVNNDAGDDLIFGTAAVSIYLFIVSAVIVSKVLWSDDVIPPAHDPNHLYQPKFNALQIRRVDLKTRQQAIESNRKRSYAMAFWLNCSRAAVLLTPIVFMIAFYLS